MRFTFYTIVLLFSCVLLAGHSAMAQDEGQPGDDDGSSEQVESSDEAYRRQMELEDARHQDPSYTDPVDAYKKELEKIDKLPEESRDNIRDQLIDVIVENGEWEPSDALEEYPYEPTEAAKGDPVLKEQEQEAWEEQIEKYHEREAAAFGSHRGPVPGPGNPSGQEGGQPGSAGSQQGQGQQGGQQGQGGGSGNEGENESGSAGTYQPGASSSGDETSTAGVSESALDFLKGRQAQSGQSAAAGSSGQPPPGQAEQAGAQGQSSQAASQAPQQGSPQQSAEEQAQTAGAQQSAAQWAREAASQQEDESSQESDQAEQAQPENQPMEQAQSEQQAEQQPDQQQDEATEIELETRGIIAIKDLDKLEGTATPEEPEERDEP